MEKKLEIVNTLVAEGYALFDETPEQFANRWTVEVLEMVLENFRKWKGC